MEEKKKTEEKKQTEEKKLYESEYRFMNVIWDNEPVNSTELIKYPGKSWAGKSQPAIRS